MKMIQKKGDNYMNTMQKKQPKHKDYRLGVVYNGL